MRCCGCSTDFSVARKRISAGHPPCGSQRPPRQHRQDTASIAAAAAHCDHFRLILMLLASVRASYRVGPFSLVSLALLIFLVAATLQHQQQQGNTPHLVYEGAVMYRVHELGADEGGAGSRRVKNFVLQESTGSGGGDGGPERSSWRNLSVKEVAGLWKSRGEFVDTFVSSIKEIGFEAVFFESAPVTRSTMVSGYNGVHTT